MESGITASRAGAFNKGSRVHKCAKVEKLGAGSGMVELLPRIRIVGAGMPIAGVGGEALSLTVEGGGMLLTAAQVDKNESGRDEGGGEDGGEGGDEEFARGGFGVCGMVEDDGGDVGGAGSEGGGRWRRSGRSGREKWGGRRSCRIEREERHSAAGKYRNLE